jgi:hypothetical protein
MPSDLKYPKLKSKSKSVKPISFLEYYLHWTTTFEISLSGSSDTTGFVAVFEILESL